MKFHVAHNGQARRKYMLLINYYILKCDISLAIENDFPWQWTCDVSLAIANDGSFTVNVMTHCQWRMMAHLL
jgi:hypothetical protein